MTNNDLKWIKKNYGENMMKVCRLHFSTLLDVQGLLPSILISNFHISKSLINDILIQNKEEEFKIYIYSKLTEIKLKRINSNKNPYELMKEAGYTLHKCTTQDEINSYKKYYKDNEKLCTFEEERLKRCDVFFAIKNNLDTIKRSENPLRDDEYGTSVISIQFSKGNYNNVSIKNRYNHTVINPDATFNNNLDKIIPGLTDSFAKEFGYCINSSNINTDFELMNYVQGPDNKFYKYNVELAAVYYCVDNIVIMDNKIKKYEKEKYLLMEHYLIDFINKNVKDLTPFLNRSEITFKKIEKIEVIKDKNTNQKSVIFKEKNTVQDSVFTLNENNEIINVSLPNLKKVEASFLYYNKRLETINLPKVEVIESGFLTKNSNLVEIDFPNLKKINDCFLVENKQIAKIKLPEVKYIGNDFMIFNEKAVEIELSKVEEIGYNFMYLNSTLKNLILPEVKEIGNDFLHSNIHLSTLILPKVITFGHDCLCRNEELISLNLSNAQEIGTNFLFANQKLNNIIFPEKSNIEPGFLRHNKNIKLASAMRDNQGINLMKRYGTIIK